MIKLNFADWLVNELGTSTACVANFAMPVGGASYIVNPKKKSKKVFPENRLWVYKCPLCGGKAFNGDPETGMHFRGSGKCGDCDRSFSIVGMKLKPVSKDGPIAENVAIQPELDTSISQWTPLVNPNAIVMGPENKPEAARPMFSAGEYSGQHRHEYEAVLDYFNASKSKAARDALIKALNGDDSGIIEVARDISK
jgi:hypothetical protein